MSDPQARLRNVALGRLVKDPALQVRGHKSGEEGRRLDRWKDERHVSRLIDALKAGQSLPPIRVALVDGQPLLVDGFHRVEAMTRLGRFDAEALVSEATRAEAIWWAAEANLKHGLPLKRGERKAVLAAYVTARRHLVGKSGLKSYAEIAKEIGLPKTTVFSWMRKYHPKIAGRMGDGEAYVGNGGDRPLKPAALSAGSRALAELRDAFQATTDADDRAELVTLAKSVLLDMEQADDWRVELNF